jgi:TupA-like ATPgrasp
MTSTTMPTETVHSNKIEATGIRKSFVALFRFLLLLLPDRMAISLLYFRHFRRFPDLDNPRRFSELVQSRKLAPRNPIYPGLVDKIEVKRMVASVLGPEWVIPTHWSGRQLPPLAERNWPIPFVIKANNGSGTNIFVRSPEDCDWAEIERRTQIWMDTPYSPRFREWPYELVEPRLLIEPFIGSSLQLPFDFKFYLFGGQVHFVQVDVGRENNHRRDFYDRNWAKQDFAYGKPPVEFEVSRPKSFEAMIEAAEQLTKDIDFARVDFYEIEDRPLFGEITLFPESGLAKFAPDEWDFRFGELWSPEWKQ